MDKIIPFFKRTSYQNVVLTDELIDELAETYIKEKDTTYKNVTFEQFLDYKIWHFSTKKDHKHKLKKKIKKSHI